MKKTSTNNVANLLEQGIIKIVGAFYTYKSKSARQHMMEYNSPNEIDLNILKSDIVELASLKTFSNSINWKYMGINQFTYDNDLTFECDLNEKMLGTIIIISAEINEGFTNEYVEKELRKTIFDTPVKSK